MERSMVYVWFFLWFGVPVIGCVRAYLYNRKHKDDEEISAKSYWKPIRAGFSAFTLWLLFALLLISFGGAKEKATSTYTIEPLTVYSAPENIYTTVGNEKEPFVNFAITGKGTYSAPLDNTEVVYTTSGEKPQVTITARKYKSIWAFVTGVYGAVADDTVRITLQVPVGGVEVRNYAHVVKEQDALDLLENPK